jgi:pimeloyl-ACP methyl ester carboxylesterase
LTRASLPLASWGSFHVGGRPAAITGKQVRELTLSPGGVPARIDPNGTYLPGAMYAQYMIPSLCRGQFPLLLWHGGGMTGACYETTPDGREGWQHFFLRRGWATYVSDAVERGRSGFAMFPDIFAGEPLFLSIENPWQRFRIGEGPYAQGMPLPGNQFPADHESWLNFIRQLVPRFTTTDDWVLAGYLALLARIGPAIVLAHSQGGFFAWRAAQERPDLVKALVLVEPAAIGDPDQADSLKTVPTLVLYGDFISDDTRWPAIRGKGVAFAEKIRDAGGTITVIDLPEHGIRGNSHMIMMDRNSDEVAALIQGWLAEQGFWI